MLFQRLFSSVLLLNYSIQDLCQIRELKEISEMHFAQRISGTNQEIGVDEGNVHEIACP